MQQKERSSRKPLVGPVTSLDSWVYKGNKKDKARTNVSTVDALDMNESDTTVMVYAAMVHHAADSFIDYGDSSGNNVPDLEVKGKDETQSIAVESPKDRLQALLTEPNAVASPKGNPSGVQSEVVKSSTQQKIAHLSSKVDKKVTSKKGRRLNPAACDSSELDMLTSLDVSPIKITSGDEKHAADGNDTNGTEDLTGKSHKDRPNNKRSTSKVDTGGSSPLLVWIEANNVSKPPKRARKAAKPNDTNAVEGFDMLPNTDVPKAEQKTKCCETFTFNNATYQQPHLVLSRIKIAMMKSASSPVKPKETSPVCASTPKAKSLSKTKVSSPRAGESVANTSEDFDESRLSATISYTNRKETGVITFADSTIDVGSKVDLPQADVEPSLGPSEMQVYSPTGSVVKPKNLSPPSPTKDMGKTKSPVKEKAGESTVKRISQTSADENSSIRASVGRHMNPIVLLRSTEIVNVRNLESKGSKGEVIKVTGNLGTPSKKACGGLKRSIDFNSDGAESEEDSWRGRMKGNGIVDNEMVGSSSSLRIDGCDILETFSIESDSDDENFAPMQAAVESLLSQSSVLPESAQDDETQS